MTLFDLLIIYLACGAPFGVYYFLHHRRRSFSRQTWLKTILTFLFWIPFSYRLLKNGKIRRKLFSFKSAAEKVSEREKQLFSIRQQLEKIFLESRVPFSIYEVREVLERYAGLTAANQNSSGAINEQAAELFRVAERENIKLGAICLNRRNQKRLEFHRTGARRDFLKLIENLSDFTARGDEMKESAMKFANVLEDETTAKEIEKLFSDRLQTIERKPVNQPEKDIWTAEAHKPLPARQISIRLPHLSARTSSFTKD